MPRLINDVFPSNGGALFHEQLRPRYLTPAAWGVDANRVARFRVIVASGTRKVPENNRKFAIESGTR